MNKGYNVLVPTFTKAGKLFDGTIYYSVGWNKIGTANSMQDAKRKFGGSPVLEKI